jgi:hypothetical protein
VTEHTPHIDFETCRRRTVLSNSWSTTEMSGLSGVGPPPGFMITHESQYFADPFHAPPGRAALAEPIPAGDQ